MVDDRRGAPSTLSAVPSPPAGVLVRRPRARCRAAPGSCSCSTRASIGSASAPAAWPTCRCLARSCTSPTTPTASSALAELLAAPDTHLLFPRPTRPTSTPSRALRTRSWSSTAPGPTRASWSAAAPCCARSRGSSFAPNPPATTGSAASLEGHRLSTIEATAYVLERLERAPGRYTPMLSAFEHMVDTQLKYIASGAGADRHIRHKPPRTPKPPIDHRAPLRAAMDRLVLLHVEPNAWPYGTPDAPPVEARAAGPAGRHRRALHHLAGPAPAPVPPRAALNLDLPEADIHAGASAGPHPGRLARIPRPRRRARHGATTPRRCCASRPAGPSPPCWTCAPPATGDRPGRKAPRRPGPRYPPLRRDRAVPARAPVRLMTASRRPRCRGTAGLR